MRSILQRGWMKRKKKKPRGEKLKPEATTPTGKGVIETIEKTLIANARHYIEISHPAAKDQPGWNVTLSGKASTQLLGYQLAAESTEIGGLVVIREIPDLSSEADPPLIRVEEFVPLASGFGGLSLSSKLFAKGLFKAIEKGLDPNLIRGVWHTHPGMGLFWSRADESGIRSLLKTNSMSSSAPWLLSILASGTLITGRIDRLIEGDQYQTPLPVSWADDFGCVTEFVAEGQKLVESTEIPEHWGRSTEEWDESPLWGPSFSPSGQGDDGLLYCFLRDSYFVKENPDFCNTECIGCVHREFCLPEVDISRNSAEGFDSTQSSEIPDTDCPNFVRQGQNLYCRFYGQRVTVEDCKYCIENDRDPRSNGIPDANHAPRYETCPDFRREGQDLFCTLFGTEITREDCKFCYRF